MYIKHKFVHYFFALMSLGTSARLSSVVLDQLNANIEHTNYCHESHVPPVV